jgi:hypothetical protein
VHTHDSTQTEGSLSGREKWSEKREEVGLCKRLDKLGIKMLLLKVVPPHQEMSPHSAYLCERRQ